MFYPTSQPSTPSPTATLLFGNLPQLEVKPRTISLPANFSVQLDLYRASLPASPGIANVYPILKAPYGFLSEDRAKELARTFGLSNEPIKLSTTENVWSRPNTTLKVNIQSLNFHYEYNYGADTRVFANSSFSGKPQVEDITTSMLTKHTMLSGFGDDLSQGIKSISFLSYKSGQLAPVSKLEEATAARVDIMREPVSYTVDNLNVTIPFVSPSYVGSLTYVIVVNTKLEKNNTFPQAIEISNTHWKFQQDLASTYPIITSQSAWEEFQVSPQSYVVYVGNSKLGPEDFVGGTPEIQTFITRDSYLAYLDPEDESDFIQPVWVFTGEATLTSGGMLDWAAYVPAIDPAHLKP